MRAAAEQTLVWLSREMATPEAGVVAGTVVAAVAIVQDTTVAVVAAHHTLAVFPTALPWAASRVATAKLWFPGRASTSGARSKKAGAPTLLPISYRLTVLAQSPAGNGQTWRSI